MTIDKAALADHVRAGVAEPPARPREIVVIEEMPTTLTPRGQRHDGRMLIG